MIKYVAALCALLMTPASASEGVASFYGGRDGFCGKKTANGERLDCSAHTAAHRTLPFGTSVRVTYGGKTITVRINDRGPFVRGRVLDLGLGAARSLGINGTARVQYEVAGGTHVEEPFGVSRHQGRGHRRARKVHRRR